ncbi:MAG: 6-phosphogluconolactonase [Prolixibacteraceae bacterium]
MKAKIKIFKNTGEIADEFANTLKTLAKAANGKAVHIALSGGSTPKIIFQYLKEKFGKELANPQFHFWWGDDRCVPPTDDESNYKWANELWLKEIEIPLTNIHRVLGENDPESEAIRYAQEIEKHLPFENNLPTFDFMLLGLGEDGHTASIFPNQMELLSSKNTCEVAFHPNTGQKRITLTGPVINNSKFIVFLAIGENKASKVKEILLDQQEDLPASHIQSNTGELIWWLDKNSAQNM